MNTKPSLFEKKAAPLIAFLLMCLLCTLPVFAQSSENDFSEGFSEKFDGSFESEPAPASQSLQWKGQISTALRGYLDFSQLESSELQHHPVIGLDLSQENDNSETLLALNFDRRLIDEISGTVQDSTPRNISWYLQRIIDQAYIRLYYDRFNIQAGYLKEVWGTGDQAHVLDFLNPTDYYDFVNNNYLDRKTAELMLKLNIPTGARGLLEMAYAPTFTPDNYPVTGRWTPKEMAELTTLTGGSLPNLPEMNRLGDGQYALRLSAGLGSWDLAASYYFGFLRSPTVEFSPVPAITYDRLHAFGLDFMSVLAGFNLRGEAAYYLTEDFDGLDLFPHNNHSLRYLFGFDRDIGISSINFNGQIIGTYFLNEDTDPFETMLTVALTDRLKNDRIKPEISLAYSIEQSDFMLRPKLVFQLVDDVEIELLYTMFHGDEQGYFGQYRG
ncbi:MAG TPA: hypothetical protein ENN41_09280, partial [Sediminispirochaeta sp.]|nr:hypothetical protein [Sediminispirochaeta sp.]